MSDIHPPLLRKFLTNASGFISFEVRYANPVHTRDSANKFFCVSGCARAVYSTPRFSINYGGIGFVGICEMGNAFERLNKSDVIEPRIAAVANLYDGQEYEMKGGGQVEGGWTVVISYKGRKPVRESAGFFADFLTDFRQLKISPIEWSDDGAERSKFFIRRYIRARISAGRLLSLSEGKR